MQIVQAAVMFEGPPDRRLCYIKMSTNKKPTVARSSTEAEYRDIANVILNSFGFHFCSKNSASS